MDELMYGRTLGLTIGFLLTFSVSAEVVHFECMVEYSKEGREDGEGFAFFNIDMTEKVWETPDHTFTDVVISHSVVRANGRWRNEFNHNVTSSLSLSRNDLTFTETYVTSSGPYSVRRGAVGTCRVIEAPKVKRAF
jgi:hypothetical protein